MENLKRIYAKDIDREIQGVIKVDDESYTGVIENNVLNVKNIENKIIFKGICNGNIQEIVTNYFDLNRDYTKIKNEMVQKYLENIE